MPETTRLNAGHVITSFTEQEVAAALDAALPPEDRLAGSPVLEVTVEDDGSVLLQQRHSHMRRAE